MSPLQKYAMIALGLLLLFTAGLGVRRVVLEEQYRRRGEQMPFTLESALFYRRIKMLYDTGSLPKPDQLVQYPEGVDSARTYTLGAEWVYAAGARLLPGGWPVAERVRWLEAAWFCLGLPFLALGVWSWRRSWLAAALSSLGYAVAVSSVIRSTGQELSHENFALPLLIAHWALDVAARQAVRNRASTFLSAAGALALALALCTWDLVQYYVLLRLAVGAADGVRGRLGAGMRERSRVLWDVAALVLVGLFNPYHRSHGWLCSTPMCVAYGILLLLALDWFFQAARGLLQRPSLGPGALRLLFRTAAILLPVAVGLAWQQLGPHASSSYGHFGELLWAKLRFLNHKPADPALLTFDQRIMWVPALHSTTWGLCRTLFPAMLYLTIPAVPLVCWHSRKIPGQGFGRLVFFYGVSLAAFWLFARFHVFLSFFAAALLGAWASLVSSQRNWIMRLVVVAALSTGVVVEAVHTLRQPARWGRANVYYKELDELAEWLAKKVAPDPVLANFGVSAYIATYGKCAIILHPKFEDGVLRDRVKSYGEQLFTGTEKSFRDWADDRGARYYVYAYGEFSRESPELQMRYFVNAMDPPPGAPARLFEYRAHEPTYFQYLWGNQKYAVYKMTTRADEAMADRQARLAERALQEGRLADAEQAAAEALHLFPRHPRAVETIVHVTELRAAGFQAAAPGQGN